MVIAAPRSGTAWCANWLTTDTTLCLHDPLWTYHYSDLDGLKSDKLLGMACTGIALFPEFLASHPARKVILHRDLAEIRASLRLMGAIPLPSEWDAALEHIDGMHVHWREIFTKPKDIYEFLTLRGFDPERHEFLRRLNVQMEFEVMHPDPAVTEALLEELRGRPKT